MKSVLSILCLASLSGCFSVPAHTPTGGAVSSSSTPVAESSGASASSGVQGGGFVARYGQVEVGYAKAKLVFADRAFEEFREPEGEIATLEVWDVPSDVNGVPAVGTHTDLTVLYKRGETSVWGKARLTISAADVSSLTADGETPRLVGSLRGELRAMLTDRASGQNTIPVGGTFNNLAAVLSEPAWPECTPAGRVAAAAPNWSEAPRLASARRSGIGGEVHGLSVTYESGRLLHESDGKWVLELVRSTPAGARTMRIYLGDGEMQANRERPIEARTAYHSCDANGVIGSYGSGGNTTPRGVVKLTAFRASAVDPNGSYSQEVGRASGSFVFQLPPDEYNPNTHVAIDGTFRDFPVVAYRP